MQKVTLIFSLLFVLIAGTLCASPDQLDLNKATYQQIHALPITPQQAEDIYYYRNYINFFQSVYDLLNIDSIDQDTFLELKPLVKIMPYGVYDERAQRRDQIYYLIRRLAMDEGSSEAVSDLWEDMLMSPININTATYRDLLNMPIVTPSDVRALLRQRKLSDFQDYRGMRNAPGLTHYGATNLRHYVSYQPPELKGKWNFNYRFKFNNNPFSEEIEEVLRESFVPDSLNEKFSMWGRYDLDNAAPEISHKFRARMEDWFNLEIGALLFFKKGEERDLNMFQENNQLSEALAENSKYTASIDLKPANLKVVLGNYRATWGEGLVMENTDLFEPRRTGYSFSKRVRGIFPDLSPTEEFALKGAAMEYGNSFMNASLFFSDDKKDVVIWDSNHDGKLDDNDDIFYYIVSSPRFTNEQLESAEALFNEYRPNLTPHPLPKIDMAPRRDALRETMVGGHLQFDPFIGTHLGVTAYEAKYDRYFSIADYANLDEYLIYDSYYYKKLDINDSEISGLYSTETDTYRRNYRRVYGFDWQTTLDNVTFQGEYAELEVDGKPFALGDDPSALVASAYFNYANLNFMMLYRDYDLEFDNPYARPFAEHERFDGTILEKQYYLKNPLVSEMYYNSPWSQPERGLYIETRYKFLRELTLTKAYLDMWERKSDGRKSVRFQGELEYRPIYQIAMRLKQKLQTNGSEDFFTRAVSKTSETTCLFRTYLTNRDRLELEYRYTKVWMAPYTNLTNSAEPGQTNIIPTANVLIHGDMICVNYQHNFTDYFRVEGSFLFWNGHGVSHWDWEDMEIDFMGSQGMKFWFNLYNRISNSLAISFKYKVKHYQDDELYLRKYNEPIPGNNYVAQTKHKESSIRVQLDWTF